MSALPPKADMFGVEIDVCFVPKADTNLVLGHRRNRIGKALRVDRL
jgi:hypothetical protein